MLMDRTLAIREFAAAILDEGRVDAVLGHARGTVPMRDRPILIRDSSQVGELIWSGFCVGNPATYLSGFKGRIGIVAQGCVSRNIVGLIQERQIERDRVVVLGVPCLGMLDRRKIQAKVGGRTILEVVDDGEGEITVRGMDFEERLVRAHMRRDNCMTCMHRNPVIHDFPAASPVDETGGGSLDKVAAPWESLDASDRWRSFVSTFASCVRCHACRDACPLCYCPVCFVDESRPQWCGKGQDDADVQTFHLLRALHCAGRCTDCGACESACPVGVKVRRLTSKLEKDVRFLYGHEPGLDPAGRQPLMSFKPDDFQDFLISNM